MLPVVTLTERSGIRYDERGYRISYVETSYNVRDVTLEGPVRIVTLTERFDIRYDHRGNTISYKELTYNIRDVAQDKPSEMQIVWQTERSNIQYDNRGNAVSYEEASYDGRNVVRQERSQMQYVYNDTGTVTGYTKVSFDNLHRIITEIERLNIQYNTQGNVLSEEKKVYRYTLGKEQAPGETEDLAKYIKGLEERLSDVGDDAQLANIDLQNLLQKQQQTLQTMSDVSKMLHDAEEAIIIKLDESVSFNAAGPPEIPGTTEFNLQGTSEQKASILSDDKQGEAVFTDPSCKIKVSLMPTDNPEIVMFNIIGLDAHAESFKRMGESGGNINITLNSPENCTGTLNITTGEVSGAISVMAGGKKYQNTVPAAVTYTGRFDIPTGKLELDLHGISFDPVRLERGPYQRSQPEKFYRWRVFACAAMLSIALAACSGKQPTAPPPNAHLRIETGMHTSSIRDVAVSPAGDWFATVSDDKSLRLWSLPDGAPIGVIRVPVGEGAVGKLHAAAVSPDGKTLAIGGLTRINKGEYAVYLFTMPGARKRRLIGGLPGNITALDFSSDGDLLAIGLGGKKNGLRVFETGGYDRVFADDDYGRGVSSVDFAPDNRLVSVSKDGFVRLYGSDFVLKAKVKPSWRGRGEKVVKPRLALFSPTGDSIAVAIDDSLFAAIQFLSAEDLSLATAFGSKRETYTMAWSADGKFIYTSGRDGYSEKGSFQNATSQHFLSRWEVDSYQGKEEKLPIPASSSVFALAMLSDGKVLFASAEPVFGILDGEGKVVLERSGDVPDFRGMYDLFRVSADGTVIDFTLDLENKRPVRFSLAAGTLTIDPEADKAMRGPVTSASGIYVKNWKNRYDPKLKGKKIELEIDEMSRSLAVVPGGERFLLGSSWNLRLFGKDGALLWKKPVDLAWAVNVSGDGRIAVAALANSTIRWFRLDDGKELLALFPHTDGKRWIAWTPRGYYMASPGSDGLIGWQLNKDADEDPAYYPASQFKSDFDRSDVVKRVLETLDEDEALYLADHEK